MIDDGDDGAIVAIAGSYDGPANATAAAAAPTAVDGCAGYGCCADGLVVVAAVGVGGVVAIVAIVVIVVAVVVIVGCGDNVGSIARTRSL